MNKHVIMRLDHTKNIPEAWQNIAKVFIALGDRHRQRILLIFDRGERLNVSRIVQTSTLSRPAVSHHLKILRDAGVLGSVKEGKEVFYWIEKKFLHDALSAVLDYIDQEA
jgi:ArsR family transcriptional regulator, arsenate/arsenite/antimonite-responsive transcriptional repressor